MISFFIGITTAAVCVYPACVCDAVKALKAAGCDIPVASGKFVASVVVLSTCFQFFNSDTLGYYLYSFIL